MKKPMEAAKEAHSSWCGDTPGLVETTIQSFLDAVDVEKLADKIWDGRSPLKLAAPDIQDAYIIRAKRVLIHLKAMTEKK